MRLSQQYWTLAVSGDVKVAGSAFVTASLKGDVFVSATTKLCSLSKCCKLDSKGLAEDFAIALRPILEKRQGTQIDVTVEVIEDSASMSRVEKLRELISIQSSEVRARLRTQNFAPNKPA